MSDELDDDLAVMTHESLLDLARLERKSTPTEDAGAAVSEQRPIMIVVIDDHTMFAESIARVLDAKPDFEVVAIEGTVADGRSSTTDCPTATARRRPARSWR